MSKDVSTDIDRLVENIDQIYLNWAQLANEDGKGWFFKVRSNSAREKHIAAIISRFLKANKK